MGILINNNIKINCYNNTIATDNNENSMAVYEG